MSNNFKYNNETKLKAIYNVTQFCVKYWKKTGGKFLNSGKLL